MYEAHCPIMCWHLHGLNMPTKCTTICEVANVHQIVILWSQQTKIDVWSAAIDREVGGSRLANCMLLPAISTRANRLG